ncbi:RmlD substrate binding domain-containing protein [Streptomyces puniciscabiei]|uniref:RmlD substrate binding domain-containing protein n=1 Tax=Streptomyces puniciscabiei TaxID=164348 RepID=A0A542THR3_9ACTN|nr:sugar nucleotide-binding protein [Streptomyces puniciscabiei]TQK86366.1 RmlD substrate binding domain-containing protein [Streptomyces puniciscabiei]
MTIPWLITGAGGVLGRDLLARLRQDGEQAVGPAHGVSDLTDADTVDDMIDANRSRNVADRAARSAVHDAEAREADALRVGGGPRHLAEARAGTGARLIQVPTAQRSACGPIEPTGEQALLARRSRTRGTSYARPGCASRTGSYGSGSPSSPMGRPPGSGTTRAAGRRPGWAAFPALLNEKKGSAW